MSRGMVLVLAFVMANSLSPHVHGQTLNKTEQERAHRVMQLERRAILIGDQTGGKVMLQTQI